MFLNHFKIGVKNLLYVFIVNNYQLIDMNVDFYMKCVYLKLDEREFSQCCFLFMRK